MPIDNYSIATALNDNRDAIEAYLTDDYDLIERYRDVFESLPREWSSNEIKSELESASYPGALPIDLFDTAPSLIETHEESNHWESHEAVNDWARDILRDVPVLAVDGSELPPTTQYNLPVAYIQTAWCLNYHHPDGKITRGLDGKLLTPDLISTESANGEYRFIDSKRVGHHRFAHEGAKLITELQSIASAYEEGELDHRPVVFYDGPLVGSFATPLKPETRDRYLETLSNIVAASQHHKIPLVGYVAGSNASELVKMTRLLLQEEFGDSPVLADSRILTELMSPWGDTTIPFASRRDGSVDALETTYKGEQYSFKNDLLFSYLKVPPGTGLDRIEFPGWLIDAAGPDGYDSMYDYTKEIIRAEAAIGRGYPEILQQADSDAVISQQDRDRFTRILGRWAEENNVPLEWNAKALSKERRRR